MEEDETQIRPLSDFVTDVDNADFTVEVVSDHLLVTVEGDQLTLVPEADFHGEANLTITATDVFGAQGSDMATVEVTPVNDSPVLNLPASVTIAEDDTLDLDLSTRIVDPDNELSDLELLITPSPGLSWALDQAAGVLQSWAAPDSSGLFTLTISVSDDALGEALGTVEVEIEAVNDPPTISGLPELTLEVDSSTSLALDAYVTDDGAVDLISWSVLPGLGLSAIVDAQQRTVTINSILGFQGASSLLFIATDAEEEVDSEIASVLVQAPEEDPPGPDPAELAADFDGSGRVDLDDFFLFSDMFGTTVE